MNFGLINKYMLLGGGKLLCLIAQELRGKYEVFVVTSERHSTELINVDQTPISLVEFLEREQIDFKVSKDITRDSVVASKIGDDTIGISFGAAWIFRQQFIDLFAGRLFNCHGTRLPQGRGGGAFSWDIMRREGRNKLITSS
jgi:methionyl-tRNA formyltransferase